MSLYIGAVRHGLVTQIAHAFFIGRPRHHLSRSSISPLLSSLSCFSSVSLPIVSCACELACPGQACSGTSARRQRPGALHSHFSVLPCCSMVRGGMKNGMNGHGSVLLRPHKWRSTVKCSKHRPSHQRTAKRSRPSHAPQRNAMGHVPVRPAWGCSHRLCEDHGLENLAFGLLPCVTVAHEVWAMLTGTPPPPS
jgi:hypothetical protein